MEKNNTKLKNLCLFILSLFIVAFQPFDFERHLVEVIPETRCAH